jgi:magnesium transporter
VLSVYVQRPTGLVQVDHPPGAPLPAEALWVDLLEPTAEEEKLVEDTYGIDVPTREEMSEIEASSRLYEEKGSLFMTATIVTRLDTSLPQSNQVTFILSGARLITNRYTDPLPFRRFISYSQTHPGVCTSGAALLAGLIEAVVNRIADVLERVGADVDSISSDIFSRSKQQRPAPPNFGRLLERIGQCGDLVSKARESLVSLARLLVFIQQSGDGQVSPDAKMTQDARTRFRTLSRDVTPMSDHATFLGDKVQFLLDATLGMVSIDQNNILKIFSVVTLFLLPPSVVVGFYGMNFEHIPWLHATWGPWYALVVMFLSAILPYLYFKRRRWL